MRLLHIDSSILGEGSASRRLTATIVAERRRLDPGLIVDYLDLVADPLSHLTAADLGAPGASADDPLERFLAADIVVVGAPMYNFTIPSQLKAWIDRILVAGRTFEYTAEGPRGLAGDKEVIVAVARGGLYGPGSAAAPLEHVQTLLDGVFRFVGIARLRFIVAEGLQAGQRDRSVILDEALNEARGGWMPDVDSNHD